MIRHVTAEAHDPRDRYSLLDDSRIQRQKEGCWLWMGSRTAGGYGRHGDTYAHRLMYAEAHGAIPEGLEVMHTCDNPPCVNPAHLRAATHRENMIDAWEKRRIPKPPGRVGWTECMRGHPFTPESTIVDRNGKRECRICRRKNRQAWRERNRV